MQKKLIDKRLLTLYDKNIKYTGSILNKNTTYKENDIISFEGAILKVTAAGTTDSTLKAIRTFLTTAKTGDTIVSGTATLKLMSLTDDIVIEDWKPKTNYIVNNVVMNDNKLYRCTKAHTSTTDIYADIANWEYIAPFHDWKTSTQYVLNDIVINDKKIYRCTTAHTSTNTFDETKWEEISALENTVRPWATKTDYKANDLIYIDNVLYKCNTAHTSTTFSADVAKWDNMYSNIRDFADNTFYKKGSYVLYNNNIYKALADTTSGTDEMYVLVNNYQYSVGSGNVASSYTKIIGYRKDNSGNPTVPIYTEPNGNYYSVVVDLGATHNIKKLFLTNIGSGGFYTFLTELAIYGSIDGNNYTQIHEFSYSVNEDYGSKIALIDKKYRYAKFVLISYATGHPISSNYSFNCNIMQYETNSAWQKITNTQKPTIEAWTSNTDYSVDEVVIYNNKIYKCNKAHTSTTDFGADKLIYWNSLNDNPIINDWASGTTYEVGSMVIISNANNISEWTTNTSYNANDEVIYNGYIYMCKTANTDATFTESNWTIKEPVYNRMYRCIKENKDATFTEANWQLINGDSVAKESDVEDLLL